MSRVLILIVTYNAEKWIYFFGSSFTNLPVGWEVIVVDNASTDNTVALLHQLFPYFTIVESKTNLGFGRANNIGLKYAMQKNFDHVLLLNQDAKISINNILRLIYLQEEHPNCLIMSPIHFNENGQDIDKSFASYCLPEFCPGFLSDAIKGNFKKKVYHSTRGNAAIWLLSRNCLMSIGGFNPIFFHYGEDDEYRNRVLSKGFKLGIVPSSFAYHHRSDCSSPLFLASYDKNSFLVTFFDHRDVRPLYKHILHLWLQFIKSICKLRFGTAKKKFSVILFAYRHFSILVNLKKITFRDAPNFLE